MTSPSAGRPPRETSRASRRAPARAGPTRFLTAGCTAASLALGALAAPAGAAVYVVDRAHPSCSDAGPGSASVPYCTISAALAARGGAGTTIVVRPGVYREQVTVGAGGAAGAPLVLRGEGLPLIEGADDLGAPSAWTLHAGSVWRAASVTWVPRQVFASGARLAESAAAPSSLPPGTFRHVAGEGLYVNVGGANPGAAPLLASRRDHGVRVSGHDWVSIEGFQVARTNDRGIYLSSGADQAVVADNVVTHAFRVGIAISNSAGARVERNVSSFHHDHGISLSGATGATLRGNECRGNSKPAGTSSGIYLSGSSSNVIEGNRLADNTSSGFYAQSASNDNLLVQNRSWRNARHGFDLYGSTGTRQVGDVAWGNVEDGFSVRNGSTGTSLRNCIAAGNAGRCLSVESNSAAGLSSNDHVLHAAGGAALVRHSGVDYATLAAWSAASGNDTRSVAADPRFVDAAAGDFRLAADSPAIDAADSSVPGWPATDAEGNPRHDDPAVPNSGAGPVAFADRGALERVPPPAPVARLTLTPASGPAPLAVTADASASSAGGAPIVSYRFDFGDGATAGPQAGAVASRTFAAGTWTVRVTVTDAGGRSDDTTAVVTATVESAPRGVIDSPATDLSILAGHQVVLMGSGTDADGDLPLAYAWDLGGGAPNAAVEDPGPVTFATPGVYTITLRVQDAGGVPDPDPPRRVITVSDPAALPADEIHWTITGPTSVTFDWRGPATTIAYGTTTAYGSTVAAAAPSPMPYSSAGPFREARLTGLAPGTLYHYSIGGGPDHTFRTPPARGSSGFTALVSADVGSSRDYDNVAPMQALIAWQRPALAIMAGDLTYGDAKGAPSVDRHFNDVMVWSQDVPYLPSWGNHEWGSTVDDLRNYKGRFDLPNAAASPGAPASGCCGEDWYWFDYGNVRFIVYPEPYTSATWANWYPRADSLMAAVRTDPQIRFIVTFGHRPAYSSGHHGGDGTLRGILDSLGVRHPKYVLNVNGHSHNYERSHPQRGVIHVTSGGGGSSLERRSGTCGWAGGCPPPAWSAFRTFRHGALRLRFTHGGIVGEALCGPPDEDQDLACTFGSVFDQFVIGVPDLEPVVGAPATAAGAEGVPLVVSVSASDPDGDAIGTLEADLSRLPPGHDAVFVAAADRASGTLTWTPGFADSGVYPVTFRAANALAGAATTSLRIANVDRPPAVSAPAGTSVSEAATLTLAMTAADPDGDAIATLEADLSNLPAGHGATFTPAADRASGTLAWTPGHGDSGRYVVTFTARNALSGGAATAVAVLNVDRPPALALPPPATVEEGGLLRLTVSASDPDGDAIGALGADFSGLPAGHDAAFAPEPGNATGTLTWRPTFADSGSHAISFTAANALAAAAAMAVRVIHVDLPPAVQAPPQVSALEAARVTVTVTATDPDGDAIASLTADLSALPAGHDAVFTAALDRRSGTLAWTPTFADSGSYAIPFLATNAITGRSTTTIRVGNVDRPPRVTAPATAAATEGARVTVSVTAADPDGDAIGALAADLGQLPAGHDATFVPSADRTAGVLTWTPGFADSGVRSVVFTASNALSGSAPTSIRVANVDRPPVVSAPASVAAREGEAVSVVVTAADPDGDAIAALAANLSGLPAGHGAVFTPAADRRSGTLSWTPSFDAGPASYSVSFTATNALGGTASTVINVATVDRPPVVTAPASVAAREGEAVTVVVTAADPDGEPIASLAANLSGLPAGHGAVFTPAADRRSGTLSWTPSFDAGPASYSVAFTATNALGGTASSVINVATVDRPPVVTAPASVAAQEGEAITVTVAAADPDGDAIASLAANLSGLPAGHGATFTPAADRRSGTLSWTPSFDAGPASYSVSFTATNALGGTASSVINVATVDRPPVVTAPASVAAREGEAVTVTVGASDPDGDAIASLAANLSGLPAGHGATFTPAADRRSGTLSWTPSFDAGPASYSVSFTATNALGASASTVIQVATVDRPPVVTAPASVAAREGEAVTVTVAAADPDGDAIASLAANLSGLPAGHGATFTPAADRRSGTLSWTPSFDAGPASYSVSFTATNALGGTTSTVIEVAHVDRPPVVALPAGAVAREGEELRLEVTAADPDGEPIASLEADFSSLPAGHGARFDAAPDRRAGVLLWTPDFDDAGGPYGVTLRAANTLTGTNGVAITVEAVDRPPAVLAPAETTAVAGATIAIAVAARDPDGDAIAILDADVSGLPAGHDARFEPAPDRSGGTLRWTPAPLDTGLVFVATFSAANGLAGSAATRIAVAANRPPRAMLELEPLSGAAPLVVTAGAAGSSDPDGAIVSYRFEFGDGAAAGPQPQPWASHAYAAGNWLARLIVTDDAGEVDTAEVVVHAMPSLVPNPSFEAALTGWNAYAGSSLARVPGGVHGQWALEVTAPAATATFGVNDSPDLVSRSAVAGRLYRYGAWVRGVAGAGSGRLQVREFLNGVQQGPTALSPPVPLSSGWTRLELDYEARAGGSSLNFQVLSVPSGAGHRFQTDAITLVAVDRLADVAPEPTPLAFAARIVPNPARGTPFLALTLGRPGPARIRVIDAAGREARSSRELSALPAGSHRVPLLAAHEPPLPVGVYFFRVETAEGVRGGRFVVLR